MERSLSIWNAGFPSTCCPIGKPKPSKSGYWPIRAWRSSVGIAVVHYADGAKQGAPQATQVADRWHLLVRRIGACVDSFQRKEGLRAKDP